MKVLVSDPLADAAIDILRKHAEVDIQTTLTPEQLQSIIGEYEALIVRSQTKVTASIIEAAHKLQIIGRAGVGVDNIDVDTATRHGIVVVNSPAGNIASTAEHTIAMLLALARHIPKADRLLHSGVWNRKLKGHEIRHKTLGIIGLGRVGTEVAQMARGLHMNVIAYDPMVSETRAERLGVELVELEPLLKTADFISVHVPLNSDTRGLIGREQLKLMKKSAMIINCARGGIVDEEALYEALEQDLLTGAAIDVYTQEPTVDNVLLKSDKVVATPHLAASTFEAEVSASTDVAKQVVAVLQGQPAESPVNAPVIPAEAMTVLGPYLQVGTIIGRVAMQLISGNLEALTIHYEGDIAREETRPIKVAILSSLLEMMTDERINIVNADFIASNRGIKITEQKDTTCENYTSMVTVEVKTRKASTVVGATSLRGKTYLTRVDDYWMEIEPSTDYLLFTEHKDRPGVIGAVGTIIGDAGVNISQMQVSLGSRPDSKAMMVLSLEQSLPADCYQKILAVPDMYRVTIIKLIR